MSKGVLKVFWRDVCSSLTILNPKLAEIIDRLCLEDSFYFYKVSYPFGATILDKGLFYVPLENGEIVPINDAQVNSQIQKDLQYAENGLPTGILLKNSYELFIDTEDRILPVIVPAAGEVLSLWKQLDEPPGFHAINIFSAKAGARSIFMLANIADYMSHHNLRRDFNVHHQPPATLLDQWDIFKSISDYTKNSWRLEILLLPGIWLEKIKSDFAWHELYQFFLQHAWHSSRYERNQIFYEYAFSCAQANRNLKPNPCLLDTVRHIISITLSSAPGFRPATDESLGPIALFQEAYVESYGLKKYAPTIMHPAHFDLFKKESQSVYYSLQLPTTLSFLPRSRQLFSTLFDMRETRYITKIFMEELAKNNRQFSKTILGEIPKLVEYEFFHNKPDQHQEIILTDYMLKIDPSLNSSLYKLSSTEFSANGTFLRGCIRIKNKIS